MQTILLVGERENVVAHFAEKLLPFGIEQVIHLDDPDRVHSVPKSVEAIVVVYNNSTPPLNDAARDLAITRQLPFVRVRHQWARALPVLRANGVLPPAGREKHELKINQADVKEIALTYITGQRAKGRAPKFGEVEAVLQTAFGPNFSLTSGTYREFSHRAAAIQPMPLPDLEKPTTGSTEHAIQFGQLILEEKPELVLDSATLYKEIKDILDDDDGGEDLPVNWPPRQAAVAAIKAQQELWTSDKIVRQAAQDRWAKRLLKIQFDSDGTVPTYRELIAQSKEIWGVGINGTRLPQLRGDVLGEWAAGKLITELQAHTFYGTQAESMGLPRLNRGELDQLFHTNEIKRVSSKRPHGKWETTEGAIMEYLKAHLPEPPDAPPEPIDEPTTEPQIDEPAEKPEPEVVDLSHTDFILAIRDLAEGTATLRAAIAEARKDLAAAQDDNVLVSVVNELSRLVKNLGNSLHSDIRAAQAQVQHEVAKTAFPMEEVIANIQKAMGPVQGPGAQVPHLSVNKLTLEEGSRLVLDPDARIHVDEMTIEAGAIIELVKLV